MSSNVSSFPVLVAPIAGVMGEDAQARQEIKSCASRKSKIHVEEDVQAAGGRSVDRRSRCTWRQKGEGGKDTWFDLPVDGDYEKEIVSTVPSLVPMLWGRRSPSEPKEKGTKAT